MIDEKILKERYLRDAVSARLGNLASSIKRLGYFMGKKYDARVQELLQECLLFSEWTAPDAEFETRAALAILQLELKNWQNHFKNMNEADDWRAEINAACERWANRILELSGLLKTGRSGVAPA